MLDVGCEAYLRYWGSNLTRRLDMAAKKAAKKKAAKKTAKKKAAKKKK